MQTIHNWENGRFVPDDRNLETLSKALGVSIEDLRGQAFAALLPVTDPFLVLPVIARLDGADLVVLDGAARQPWTAPFVIEIGGESWAHHDLYSGDHAGIDPTGALEVGKLFLIRRNRRHSLSALQIARPRLIFSIDAEEASPASEEFAVLGRVTWHMRRM